MSPARGHRPGRRSAQICVGCTTGWSLPSRTCAAWSTWTRLGESRSLPSVRRSQPRNSLRPVAILRVAVANFGRISAHSRRIGSGGLLLAEGVPYAQRAM